MQSANVSACTDKLCQQLYQVTVWGQKAKRWPRNSCARHSFPRLAGKKLIKVRDISGVGDAPRDRTALSEWLRRRQIPIIRRNSNGGETEFVNLSDLPEQERRAYLERLACDAGLETGAYDDAAHAALMQDLPINQSRAHENAAMLMFIAKRDKLGMIWRDIEAAGQDAFGKRAFPTRNTWKTWKKLTDGVDPANWAPALAPKYGGGGIPDPHHPEAFARLYTLMVLSGKNGTGYPLKKAYQIVADEAKAKDWAWPKLHTVRRLWKKMDPVARLYAELGEERASAMLRMTQVQHTRDMAAMDIVDCDGREFKVRAVWPDGYVGCPWVVALVDRASRKTVGYAVGKSENADVTEAALVKMCDTHYRPLVVSFDNGGAFNSKRIWGGQMPFFRKKQTKAPDWEVPGVLSILCIEGRNKGVRAKTSNLQENVWSHLRHIDNDPRFHGAQRPGPNDPENRNPGAVPLASFEAVLAQEVARLNSETNNRVSGLTTGESREMAFERLLKDGAKRVVTPFMRRRLGMVWQRKTVQRDGRIRFNGGFFGDHTTQRVMLRHVGKQVLVGFNPSDFDQPAMVFHWVDERKRGSVILECLPAFKQTAHGSTEGKRAANAEKKRLKKLFKELERSNPDADVAGLRETILRTQREGRTVDATKEGVVELPTGGGFAVGKAEDETAVLYLTEERLKNFNAASVRRLSERF